MPGGGGAAAEPQLSAAARNLLDNDVRQSTKKQYESKLRVFQRYCDRVGADPATCHPNTVLNFLAELRRERELTFQTICGYRSAISRQHTGVAGGPLGQVPAISRLVRACFLEKPPLPRYADTWQVDTVLRALEAMHPATGLSDMDLSIKTATLTFVLTLSRWMTHGRTKFVVIRLGGFI